MISFGQKILLRSKMVNDCTLFVFSTYLPMLHGSSSSSTKNSIASNSSSLVASSKFGPNKKNQCLNCSLKFRKRLCLCKKPLYRSAYSVIGKKISNDHFKRELIWPIGSFYLLYLTRIFKKYDILTNMERPCSRKDNSGARFRKITTIYYKLW